MQNIKCYLGSLRAILYLGWDATRQAFAGGQYHDPKGIHPSHFYYPKGLFYGGSELQRGLKNIGNFLIQNLYGASHYVAIDVHTGLGTPNEDILLSGAPERDPWAIKQGTYIMATSNLIGGNRAKDVYTIAGGFPEGLQGLFNNPAAYFKPLNLTSEILPNLHEPK
jgi:hypothetical protein